MEPWELQDSRYDSDMTEEAALCCVFPKISFELNLVSLLSFTSRLFGHALVTRIQLFQEKENIPP